MFFLSWQPTGPKSSDVPNDPYTPEPSSRIARDLQNDASSSIASLESPGLRIGSHGLAASEDALRTGARSAARMRWSCGGLCH